LGGESHVAVVAEAPLEGDALDAVTAALERAESGARELPAEINEQLLARRRRFKELGLDYLEIREQGRRPRLP
jgi:hypothetical protein